MVEILSKNLFNKNIDKFNAHHIGLALHPDGSATIENIFSQGESYTLILLLQSHQL